MRKILMSVMICFMLIPVSSLFAQSCTDPWDFVQQKMNVTGFVNNDSISPWMPLTDIIITIYQDIISPIDGEHCPMYPSCSQYCKEAVCNYGLMRGILLSTDRFHRCGHDLKYYPPYIVDGRILYYDNSNH